MPQRPPIDNETRRHSFAGAITNFTKIMAADYIVKGFKSNGIWEGIQAVYIMSGGSPISSQFNLKNARDYDMAFRLTFFNSPTFSHHGIDWNGTTQYANTHLNLVNTLNVPSHVSYYSREDANTSTDQIDIGATNAVTSCWLSCYYNASGFTSSLARNCSNSVLLTGSNTSSAGFYISDKTASLAALYRNNAQLTSAVDSAAVPSAEVFIGSHNNNSVPAFFTNRQGAFASIGIGLGATKAFIMYYIVQNSQIINFGNQV